MLARTALLLVCSLLANGTTRGRDSQNPGGESAKADRLGMWRTSTAAGCNVLWLLLQAHGRDFSYEAVHEALHTEGKTASIGDLQEAGESLGSPVVALEATFPELLRLPMPVIVHMDPIAGDYRHGGSLGVLTSIDQTRKRVLLYDGVTFIEEIVNLDDFLALWSGAVVAVTDDDSLLALVRRTTPIIGVLALSYAAICLWKRRRT